MPGPVSLPSPIAAGPIAVSAEVADACAHGRGVVALESSGGGASLHTNLALVRANAELAGQVAVALATGSAGPGRRG